MVHRTPLQLMRQQIHTFLVASLPPFMIAIALCGFTGCNQGPGRAGMPDFDPSESADKALELYDADGSGALSQAELENCPGIGTALDRFDSDGNGEVSGEEIEARIEEWIEKKSSSLAISISLRMNGKPLGNAKIEMVPASYMGDLGLTIQGHTGPRGSSRLVINKDKSNEEFHDLPGIPPGLYTIRVTHPDKDIPAKYNTDSTLGAEISYEMGREGVSLNLKSR